RVDAWSQAKADLSSAHFSGSDAGYLFKRDDAVTRGARQLGKPAANQSSIHTLERNHVGNRAKRHDIEITANVRIRRAAEPTLFAQPCAERDDHVKSQSCSTEPFVGESAILAMWVDHCHRGRKFIGRLMMV